MYAIVALKLLVPNDPASEALGEEMTLAHPLTVKPLRVETVQSVHPGRHAVARCLDQEVEVGAEQAPGVKPPAEHLRHAGEQDPKPLAISVVEET